MSKISLLFNVFLGETSPLIAARIDSPPYQMGAKRMENMIPMLTGGIRKRPGTWYDGTTKNNQRARLIDWILSDGNCIILELTAGVIRVWQEKEEFSEYENLDARADEYADKLLKIIGTKDYPNLLPAGDVIKEANECADGLLSILGNAGGVQDKPFNVIQQMTNTYSDEQIEEIKYAASANSLWLVHRTHRPLKLAWNGYAVIKSYPAFTGKDFANEGNRPGAVAFDAGRLCFAGTINEPNRIYLSRPPDSLSGTDRYTNFTVGDNPADAIVLEENDMYGGRIQWIAANRKLLAATEKATWSDTGEVPTPATFDMNIIEYAGSNELQPKGTKEIMVYSGRSGKTLRALVWSQDNQGGGFIDTDISEQAAHLFTAGIKDFAIADYPYPVIWIVTKAGELISCTVDIRGGILAYARHPTKLSN
jgi:hypothetical protein